jgi:hypothetical protein
MTLFRTSIGAGAILVMAVFAVGGTSAVASPSSGVSFTTLTVQNFLDPDQINSELVKFQTKDATTVRMQSATWNANATSGWHHHPGVIIGVVSSGSVTVWDGACKQTTYGPGLANGAVFLEGDNMLMQATSTDGATEYVTHVVPYSSTPVYRIEDQAPGCATATRFRSPHR